MRSQSNTLSCAMPPRDVGALVSRDGGAAEVEASTSCGCETALSATDCDDPYAPAVSLRLRIGDGIDWSDVAVTPAAVLERDDSTIGAGANPKRTARRSAARSSLSAPAPGAVAVVIGGLLLAPAGKAARDHHGRRRRSPCQLQLQLGGRARVFASGEAAGHHQALAEPGSPKVSCLGGVRSQPRRTAAAEGIAIASGRRWWAWLVADIMSCCCCGWKGRRRRDRRPRASEAE